LTSVFYVIIEILFLLNAYSFEHEFRIINKELVNVRAGPGKDYDVF